MEQTAAAATRGEATVTFLSCGLPGLAGPSREPSIWLPVLNEKTCKPPAGVDAGQEGGAWGGEDTTRQDGRGAGMGAPVLAEFPAPARGRSWSPVPIYSGLFLRATLCEAPVLWKDQGFEIRLKR